MTMQNIANTMKAFCFNSFSRGHFKWCDRAPIPKIGPHEVLVKVHGASINHMDYFAAQIPVFRMARHNQPGGFDLAGTVARPGDKILDFKSGDRVYGFGQGFAEYAKVKPWMIARAPSNIDDLAVLAAYPSVAVTAHQIVQKCWLQRAYADRVKKVLVIGASGGVGSSLLQLFKHYGPDDIEITAVSSSIHEQHCLSKGATKFIDYTKQKVPQEIAKGSLDMIVDTVSGNIGTPRYVDDCMPLLNHAGLYISTNSLRPRDYVEKAVSLFTGGNPINHQFELFMMNPFRCKADLEAITSLVESEKFNLEINEVLPFKEESIRAGLAHVEERHSVGKTVIRIS
jgi:NADPH:quinone reductase-like Zn-dependent oxidoreductase